MIDIVFEELGVDIPEYGKNFNFNNKIFTVYHTEKFGYASKITITVEDELENIGEGFGLE